MEYRRLGKTGLQVSVLSLGSWLTFGNQVSDDVAEELMQISYDAGINFFDNAEGYHFGQSEIVMGNILKKLGWDRTTYIISSKVYFGSRRKPVPNQIGLSRKHLVEACNEALKRFQTDYLDLYFCHRPDPSVPIAEVVRTMNTLIAQGKILYWGTSEWSAVQIMEANAIARDLGLEGPSMEQPQYNMFWREKMEKDYLHIFANAGLGTTIWSPLAGGTLTEKYAEGTPSGTRMTDLKGLDFIKSVNLADERLNKIKALNEYAKELGTTLAKLAIAWCVQNPNVSTVILGASKPEQLRETLTALDVVPLLTPSVNERLEAILQNKPQMITL
ncbi:MAG: aldo/keto reductase [Saprospiraceae bacterium]|nr:aldo/keto reductase [Saprospiraceae bacterium]